MKLLGAQSRKETHKAAAGFGVDVNNLQLWWKLKAALGKYEAS
jgi:hypothetical protein